MYYPSDKEKEIFDRALRHSVIFKAKPLKEPMNFEKLRKEIMQRFAETLAYLAKH